MYLRRRRLAEARLRRVRARAQTAQGGRSATRPLTGIYVPSPSSEAASRLSGTWADKPEGRRRCQRIPVTAQISLRRSGAFNFEVLLGDVSANGCKVELVELAGTDERVVARFPGLEPFGATVTWVDGHWAGIRFDRAIHPAVFEQLLSRLA